MLFRIASGPSLDRTLRVHSNTSLAVQTLNNAAAPKKGQMGKGTLRRDGVFMVPAHHDASEGSHGSKEGTQHSRDSKIALESAQKQMADGAEGSQKGAGASLCWTRQPRCLLEAL
jgi:hypothetical protein